MGFFNDQHIHIHVHTDPVLVELFKDIRESLIVNNQNLDKHMATILEQLNAINEQVKKSKAEIVQKISDLENAIGGEPTPEVQAALDALKAEVQGIDDIVPDAPVTE